MVLFEIALVLGLILINGLLAMAELAIVSSRPARLRSLQGRGVRGAHQALLLAAEPGRFLSTVQTGITLVGVLSGAFSGATLGDRLAALFMTVGLPEGTAYLLGVGLVVTVITYLSLIVGELVPKQIALRAPERVACLLAPFMAALAVMTAPLVWLLNHSGSALLKLLGQHEQSASKVTEEEVHTLLAEAVHSGVLETGETRMIHRIMRLGDKPVRAVMTPRMQVDKINLADPIAKNLAVLNHSIHSRYPAYDGQVDNMLGVIWVKDLATLQNPTAESLRQLVRAAPIIPNTVDALDAVEILKRSPVHMGFVYDEHGTFEGIVTAADILEAIVGSFASIDPQTDEPPVVTRADGSLLLAGWLPADDLHAALGWPVAHDEVSYDTLAGMVIQLFQHIPQVGEQIMHQGWNFEVVDRDGNRVDKVLATKL